jgi:hypothetical protein
MLMMLIDGHPHRAHLGQHHVAEAGLHHEIDARDRIRTQQQLVQFDGHAFDGDATELGRHVQQGGKHSGRDGEPEL